MIAPEMPYIAVNWQSVFHWRFHKLFKKLARARSYCAPLMKVEMILFMAAWLEIFPC